MGSREFGRPGDFATRRISNTTLREIRPIALRVFHEHFRVNHEASAGDRLVSEYTEVTDQTSSPDRVREVLGTRNRRRQAAVLQLSQEGAYVLVQCQVMVQRLDTAERTAFTRAVGDDRPTDTPIDRAGTSSTNVREEWISTGRDRRAETMVLDEILQALSTGPEK